MKKETLCSASPVSWVNFCPLHLENSNFLLYLCMVWKRPSTLCIAAESKSREPAQAGDSLTGANQMPISSFSSLRQALVPQACRKPPASLPWHQYPKPVQRKLFALIKDAHIKAAMPLQWRLLGRPCWNHQHTRCACFLHGFSMDIYHLNFYPKKWYYQKFKKCCSR